MDKLSEYLPLLIIIVSAVISLVRKTNKKPEKEIVLPKEVFPEIPVYKEPAYEPVYEKPVPPKKIAAPVTPKSKIPVSEKKQPVANKEPVSYQKNVEIPDTEAYEDAGINLSDPEEIRKAVIYSEIFRSPVGFFIYAFVFLVKIM